MVVAAVDGGLYLLQLPPVEYTRSSELPTRTKIGTHGWRRNRAPTFSVANAPALGVGEHDRDAPLDLAGKKFRVASAESAPSVVAVRFQFTGGGCRCPPTARASQEHLAVGRREQVRKQPVGHRRDPAGDLAELAADLKRLRARSLEPRSRRRRPRGDHRARDVDHEEDLGVGARDVLGAAIDDRLHGAEPEERRHRDTLATSIPALRARGRFQPKNGPHLCVRRSP